MNGAGWRAVISFLALLCSCGGTEAGRDVPARSHEAPRRVISLIPSATETMLALGADDLLVARTDYDVDPALAHLPSVGQGLTPSLERLTELEPQLVIAWPDSRARSVIARLAELGVAVYTPEAQTLDDVRAVIGELGARLERQARADSLTSAIDRELAAVQLAVAGLERPSVFYVVWYEPPTSAGRGTYVHELIEIAGGRNVFEDAPGLWPQVSLEEVVRRQPEIVLLSNSEESPVHIDRLRSTVGWRDLKAVREGRVVQIDANLYNRPGPRVTEAAQQLARLLHPAGFADEPRP